MAIYHVNINLDRATYCAHLQDESELFFLVPIENDGSENWQRLQSWLDQGNEIVDDMPGRETFYVSQRKNAYPSFAEQFDKIFHDGLDAWKAEIQEIKNQFPKP